jgi:quercetin dioxygenase-like cupin family protein
MKFVDLEEVPVREPVPGYRVRFVHSGSMTMAYWEIAAGAAMPEHAHPHEQVVNVVEGEFELTVSDTATVLTPGAVAVIAPDEPHSGRAVSDCRIIDAFHPVREDYR